MMDRLKNCIKLISMTTSNSYRVIKMKVFLVLAAVSSCILGDVLVTNIAETNFAEFQWKSPELRLQVQEAADTDDAAFRQLLDTYQNAHGRNTIEDAITNLLEGFRDVVVDGNGALPPLDPLMINHTGPFAYTHTGVRATINARNIRMEGLRYFTLDKVTFNVLRLICEIQLTVPRITVTSQYDVQARLALLIVHNAAGTVTFEINRLVLSVDSRLGTNILGGGHLVLRDLSILISADHTHLRITGMTGSSIINGVINSIVQRVSEGVIQDVLANVSEILSVSLFDTINDFLKDYRLIDIIG